MRDIKFRSWDYNDKRFVRWAELLDYIATNGTSKGMQSLLDRSQQYTGLKDKNGVEIYEGDILGLVHKKHGLSNSKIVFWDETYACFDWEDANGDSWPDGFTGFYDEYEVIGNIYENKELLNENR